jgi:hypothetical protein
MTEVCRDHLMPGRMKRFTNTRAQPPSCPSH